MNYNIILAPSKHGRGVNAQDVQGVTAWAQRENLHPDAAAEKPGGVEIQTEIRPSRAQHRALMDMLDDAATDVFIVPAARSIKLLIADMDATMVVGETLDDLAEHAGIKDKIAAITARAMNGELDFEAALRERVGLLRGLPESALQQTLDKMVLMSGAHELIAALKKNGATCVQVSGGFTFFTGAVAQKLGFDHHHGNVLGVENGKLTGEVIGPILDKNAKLRFLNEYAAKLGIGADQIMAIGDGANDIPMLLAAGIGIGYQPKAAVAEAVDNLVVHGDLSAAALLIR